MQSVVIVGSTAVGKTDLSLDLAEALNTEVINADSMQLYRGMDIGTAKVPVHQRRGITHHMLDVLDVTQTANVAEYQRDAREVINHLGAQGKRAVIVGGSGLFVQALLEDLQFPGNDPAIRTRLYEEAEELGIDVLYQRLVDFDSQAAANILPTNDRRIIRALEVIELTGAAPVTELGELAEIVPSIRIGLKRDRAQLDERINQRVENMWEQGFVAEVEQLVELGLRDGVTASKALGYQQVLAALSGDISIDQAKEDTKTGTRRFARRQESWFNRDNKISWYDASAICAEQLIAQHQLWP